MLWATNAHVPQLLSPHALTTEVHVPRGPCSTREATVMRILCTARRVAPALYATRESPREAMKTELNQKQMNYKKKKEVRDAC